MTYLDTIAAQRRKDVATEKRFVSTQTFAAMSADRDRSRDFSAALLGGRPAIVAEVKRASPSAGQFISNNFDVSSIARDYELGGACAISVLTETRSFHGSFADLRSVRAATNLPVLCKDFVVDELQIWKAAAFGADAIVLITALLNADELAAFLELSTRLGLGAVVEVHTEAEASVAISAGASVIGINNRDLHTFSVDLETAHRLRRCIPDDIVVVAESGYRLAHEVRAASEAGIDAVLIGEVVMRSPNRTQAVRQLCAVHA